MELKGCPNADSSEDYENTSELAMFLKNKADMESRDPRKTAICTRKKKSLDLKVESPSNENCIRKTKSLSAQFFINIDDLINNVTSGSCDEKCQGSRLSRASSHELGSFPLAGSALPSSGDNVSHIEPLQNPNRSKNYLRVV